MSCGQALTGNSGQRVLLFRYPQMKLRHIGTERQFDLYACPFSVLVIVLGNPLSHFAGAEADHRVGARVVVGIAAKDLDPQRAFFQGRQTDPRGRRLRHILGRLDSACCPENDSCKGSRPALSVPARGPPQRQASSAPWVAKLSGMTRALKLHQGRSIHPFGAPCHGPIVSCRLARKLPKLFATWNFLNYFISIIYKLTSSLKSPVTYGINLASAYARVKNASGLDIFRSSAICRAL